MPWRGANCTYVGDEHALVGGGIDEMPMWTLVLIASAWGLAAATSLPIGALVGIYRVPSNKVCGALMSFGGGALLEALALELFGHIVHLHAQNDAVAWVAIFAGMCGGLLYAGLEQARSRRDLISTRSDLDSPSRPFLADAPAPELRQGDHGRLPADALARAPPVHTAVGHRHARGRQQNNGALPMLMHLGARRDERLWRLGAERLHRRR